MATWPSGKARVCKTLTTGSNPVDASDPKIPLRTEEGFIFLSPLRLLYAYSQWQMHGTRYQLITVSRGVVKRY